MQKQRFAALLVVLASLCSQAAPLPNTEPLNAEGDLSAQMVAGVSQFLDAETERVATERRNFWKRDFSNPAAYEASISTNRQKLREIIGATETRIEFAEIEFTSTSGRESKIAENERYAVLTVRWPVLSGVSGEGLWLRQREPAAGAVICLPDADQTPEGITGLTNGVPAEAQFARRFAEQGFDVFVPVLIDRSETYSGNEEIGKLTNQPHREWIYRQAFELGAHIIGYELQKVAALVDWLERRGEKRIAVAGYAEGGLIAFYAAALDDRIQATLVSGYFGPREKLWEEPIYRNVFGLLEHFGDAELASLVAPRLLVVEHSEVPDVKGPPTPRAGRSGAAPGRLVTPERFAVEDELIRAREIFPRNFPVAFELVHGQEGAAVLPGSAKAIVLVADKLGLKADPARAAVTNRVLARLDYIEDRQKRQIRELVDYTQHLITRRERERNGYFWNRALKLDAEKWKSERVAYKEQFWNEWMGRLPEPQKAINARSRQIYDEAKWTGYEVTLNVWPGVFAWGILCVPKDIKPDEKRPVVVCQHGLEGVPKDTIEGEGSAGFQYYKAFAGKLAERGFITFAPHNPYRGRDNFRVLQRKANPLGKTLFSVIIGQHEQILNWLETLPFVDAQRIGFYGLSYGGKTAMRVPAVLDRYALSICSADFNDWIKKNATVHSAYSYLYTGEYEIFEYALGNMWNYAEMAALIAPRPFMVERGHDDGVAPDEWVAYEFAKVQRFYDKLGIGNRTEIEVFNGPHTINGVGTFKFLHRHLNWPEPASK
ncbi:MAG TPA: dienelactone hydrolase family protein [Verrucomicrobiae bacterium]